MMNRREISEYLYYEFGYDGDVSQVSDSWPFVLSDIGTFNLADVQTSILAFSIEGEDYYVVSGSSLNFYPDSGMKLADLCLQCIGSSWIAGQNPVNLNTSILGDDSVPSTNERRSHIEALGLRYLPDTPFTILEGLFLRNSGKYLGLLQPSSGNSAVAVGSNLVVRNVPFPDASAWRRLSVAVGMLVEQGRLG